MCLCYADDTQLYFHTKIDKLLAVKGMVEDCINHVHRRLASNRLRLNPDKTEVMWCSLARRAGTFNNHRSQLVPQQSRHRTLYVTLEFNFERTFQSPIRSVRSFAAVITTFGSFGQFDQHLLKTPYVMRLTH